METITTQIQKNDEEEETKEKDQNQSKNNIELIQEIEIKSELPFNSNQQSNKDLDKYKQYPGNKYEESNALNYFEEEKISNKRLQLSNIENFELQTVSIANSNINIGKNQLIHKERNEDVKLIDEKLFLFSNIESLKEDEDGSKEIYNEKFEIRNKGL